MLEAPREHRLEGLPWRVGPYGYDIWDAVGTPLVQDTLGGLGNHDGRIERARERCRLLCVAVNNHEELCARLAELIAASGQMFRRLDQSDTEEGQGWAQAIERAVAVMERVKGGMAG